MFENNDEESIPVIDSVFGDTPFVSKDVVPIPTNGVGEGDTLVDVGA